MRKQVQILVDEYVCDVCGKKIENNEHGDFYLSMHVNNKLSFESGLKGDLCKECARKVDDLVCDLLLKNKVTERYNSNHTEYTELINFLEEGCE